MVITWSVGPSDSIVTRHTKGWPMSKFWDYFCEREKRDKLMTFINDTNWQLEWNKAPFSMAQQSDWPVTWEYISEHLVECTLNTKIRLDGETDKYLVIIWTDWLSRYWYWSRYWRIIETIGTSERELIRVDGEWANEGLIHWFKGWFSNWNNTEINNTRTCEIESAFKFFFIFRSGKGRMRALHCKWIDFHLEIDRLVLEVSICIHIFKVSHIHCWSHSGLRLG